MSDSRSRIADFRSRPSSEQLVDLHIYVVPPELWRQKHNDVLNTDVNETISAGFIRVHPESKVVTVRDDIEQQLGLDLIPKDYVLMKCVGRSLTRVKPKQEYQLKIKTFLPPLAYLPEVYLLEISPNERHLYGLSSGEGSSRAATRTSDRQRYSEDDLDRYNSRERLNVENEKIRNSNYQRDSTAWSQTDAPVLPPISNPSHSTQSQHQARATPPQDQARSTPDYSQNRHPDAGSNGQHLEYSQENSHSPDRGGNLQPPLSATPPPSSDRHKKGYESKARPDNHDRGVRRDNSPDDAYGGNRTYRARNGRGDLEDEEARTRRREAQQREEEEEQRRQREKERRRQEEQLRQWEEERRAAQRQLEDEARDREHENEIERQRLLAEQEMLDLLDEDRHRAEMERRQRQEQEDLQRQQEEEAAQRRHEAEEEAQRRREEEEAYRRRQEAALQRQQEEADLRRIEEERRRLQNDELLKADTDEQTEEELSRFPSPPPIRTTSPDQEVSEEDKNRKKAEKEKLQSQLDKAREQRRAVERQREDLVKKAKLLQTKTQNRRNHARDVWKKRYFEEKKKTSPLEDQCNRLRQEVDQIHRKLMSTLEGPKNPKGGNMANNTPSEKNNYKIQSTRLQHEIEDLKRRVENSKMKLTAEMKLRNQAETELRALRAELTQKKINLTLSRSQQLQTLASGNDMTYMTPRTMISPRS